MSALITAVGAAGPTALSLFSHFCRVALMLDCDCMRYNAAFLNSACLVMWYMQRLSNIPKIICSFILFFTVNLSRLSRLSPHRKDRLQRVKSASIKLSLFGSF